LKQYLKTYLDKYSLWTQLYGCVGIFGAFFVAVWEIPAYVGLPMFSISLFFSGAVICAINKVVDDMDFSELKTKQENELIDKINRGELPPERLDMFRRMF